MKLYSNECRQALMEYTVVTDVEKLAIKVLMTEEANLADIVDYEGIPEMTDEALDELARIIGEIRNIIGIDEEA